MSNWISHPVRGGIRPVGCSKQTAGGLMPAAQPSPSRCQAQALAQAAKAWAASKSPGPWQNFLDFMAHECCWYGWEGPGREGHGPSFRRVRLHPGDHHRGCTSQNNTRTVSYCESASIQSMFTSNRHHSAMTRSGCHSSARDPGVATSGHVFPASCVCMSLLPLRRTAVTGLHNSCFSMAGPQIGHAFETKRRRNRWTAMK